nr:hypothetical protein [Tanacetum cinerariifolium]
TSVRMEGVGGVAELVMAMSSRVQRAAADVVEHVHVGPGSGARGARAAVVGRYAQLQARAGEGCAAPEREQRKVVSGEVKSRRDKPVFILDIARGIAIYLHAVGGAGRRVGGAVAEAGAGPRLGARYAVLAPAIRQG